MDSHAVAPASAPETEVEGSADVDAKQVYLDAVSLIERLHRRFLDVVKAELDSHGYQDINNVQGLILYNIGEDVLTVGELTQRGYYLGSNVSYNVKKLVENGYLEQQRSPHDRRSVRVRVSPKGDEVRHRIDGLHERHVQSLVSVALSARDLDDANKSLGALERFWSEQLRFNA